ncbi:MAG: DNA repair protein RecN [Cyclobacteriaceae bacterium]
MLKNLSIRNYALIDELEMMPSSMLNIVTGETGAGKSIMLGAVGLLLGNRVDTKALLDTSSKCIVEATFDISGYNNLKMVFEWAELDYETETIIRREITPSGKSRAFVNDTPVNLDVLKKLGFYLMDIHSQNENLNLGNHKFQLRLVDLFASTVTILHQYKTKFKAYTETKKELEDLQKAKADFTKESDYNNFILKELIDADLKSCHQEELESEIKVLENSEEIKSKLVELHGLLDDSEFAVNTTLGHAQNILIGLRKFSKEYESLASRMESSFLEIKDITQEIGLIESKIEHDPARTEEVQGKLSEIYRLQQKHQVNSVEELLQLQEQLDKKVADASSIDHQIEQVEKALKKQFEEVNKLANELSQERLSCFEKLRAELEYLLKDVGMPEAVIQIERSETEPTINGIDQIEILFSANKGIAPQPIKSVASGGEFSRLMFCIKYTLADKTQLPTIIFDEIDTGVSGEIALKMVKMMRKMAKNHQVISISHLPQFAAQGDAHYFVYKDTRSDRSVSRIKKLESDERILEIAKMIGGDRPTDAAFENAKELLNY